MITDAKNRRTGVAILGAILALSLLGFIPKGSSAAPQVATGWFVSEGCDVYGDSFQSGSDIESFTVGIDINDNPCNWVYLNGDYYQSPNWTYDVGPGWSYEAFDGEYTYIRAGATVAADVYHSGCEAGGACSNWAWRLSWDP